MNQFCGGLEYNPYKKNHFWLYTTMPEGVSRLSDEVRSIRDKMQMKIQLVTWQPLLRDSPPSGTLCASTTHLLILNKSNLLPQPSS